jgi:prolyl 4-hydroxylase
VSHRWFATIVARREASSANGGGALEPTLGYRFIQFAKVSLCARRGSGIIAWSGANVRFDERLIGYVQALQAQGLNYSQIIVQMTVDQGYTLLVAQRIVDAVLHHGGNAGSLRTPPKILLPTVDTTGESSVIELPDRTVGVAFEQLVPRIVVLDDFLSVEECEAMCATVAGQFAPSRLGGGAMTPEDTAKVRNSFTAAVPFAANATVARVETRIEALTGWPNQRGEPLQIQKYLPGEQYLPHCDFFRPQDEDFEFNMSLGGQRLATLIIYLRTPEAGGATYFANQGLRVAPRQGSALFFDYPEPILNAGVVHGGERVITGEKWIVTKWFRQEDWRPPQAAGM